MVQAAAPHNHMEEVGDAEAGAEDLVVQDQDHFITAVPVVQAGRAS